MVLKDTGQLIFNDWNFSDSQVWISGGVQQSGATATTEFMSPDGTFSRSNDIPDGPLYLHCTVAVNSSHVFFAGGREENDVIHNDAYLVDVSDGDNLVWNRVPPMSVGRAAHECGLAGNEVIIVGKYPFCASFHFTYTIFLFLRNSEIYISFLIYDMIFCKFLIFFLFFTRYSLEKLFFTASGIFR